LDDDRDVAFVGRVVVEACLDRLRRKSNAGGFAVAIADNATDLNPVIAFFGKRIT